MDVTLPRSELVLDLGVLLDSNLYLDQYVDAIITKVNRSLGFILRSNCMFHDCVCLKALYCCIVRQIIEYASVAWTQIHITKIGRIEKIEKKNHLNCH